MIIKEIDSKFKDKLHFFRIPGIFQDQGHFQGLFKVCVNPAELIHSFNEPLDGRLDILRPLVSTIFNLNKLQYKCT